MYRKIYELTEQIQEKLCACGCKKPVNNIKYDYLLNHNKKGNKFNWKGGGF